MRMTHGLSLAQATLSCVLLAACSAQIAGVKPTELEPVPTVETLATQAVPPPTSRHLVFNFAEQPVEKKYVDISSTSGIKLRRGSGVIIDIPEYERWQYDQKVARSKNKGSPQTAELLAQVRAKESVGDNFSLAQQEFERALIGMGLNVLDRRKFEAKLRDARDSVSSTWSERNQVRSYRPGYEEAKKKARAEFDASKSNDFESFNRQMGMIEAEFAQGAEGGRNREADEISDTAEVIRAALLGSKNELRPDYLLQIRLAFPETFSRPLALQGRPEMTAFLAANPEFSDLTFYDSDEVVAKDAPHGDFPLRIKTPWYYVEFEGKLIDIKTGSVLWIGSIRTQSNNIEPFSISYTINRQLNADWAEKMTAAVAKYNTHTLMLQKDLSMAEDRLRAANDKYRNDAVVSKDAVAGYESERQLEITQSVRAYTAAMEALQNHKKKIPASATRPPQFHYQVSPPLITPDLRPGDDLSETARQQRAEAINAHKRKLLRAAAQVLISTLPME